jgi:hypothetical protein
VRAGFVGGIVGVGFVVVEWLAVWCAVIGGWLQVLDVRRRGGGVVEREDVLGGGGGLYMDGREGSNNHREKLNSLLILVLQ